MDACQVPWDDLREGFVGLSVERQRRLQVVQTVAVQRSAWAGESLRNGVAQQVGKELRHPLGRAAFFGPPVRHLRQVARKRIGLIAPPDNFLVLAQPHAQTLGQAVLDLVTSQRSGKTASHIGSIVTTTPHAHLSKLFHHLLLIEHSVGGGHAFFDIAQHASESIADGGGDAAADVAHEVATLAEQPVVHRVDEAVAHRLFERFGILEFDKLRQRRVLQDPFQVSLRDSLEFLLLLEHVHGDKVMPVLELE